MAPKFKRGLLEIVAKEMNDVMGFDQPIQADMPDDDTLLTTLTYEATGRGILKDAIRADDFESDDPKKKLFSADALKFFIDAGVWDDKARMVIIPKAAGRGKAQAPAAPVVEPELPLDDKEQVEHDEMEAGETTGEEPAVAAQPERSTPVDRKKTAAAEKAAKTKAAPAAPAGKAPEAKKEEPMKTNAAVRGAVSKKTATAKKRAAKGTAAQKKVGAKEKKATAALDEYGFRPDSMSSKALALFVANPGKYTMKEAMKKLESKCDFSYAFKKAQHVKITIDKETGKISAK